MKKRSPPKWFDSRLAVAPRHAAIIIVMSCMLFSALALSGYGETAEDKVGRPLLFWVRSHLHRAPELDPRIKLYLYNDDIALLLGKPETLPLSFWSEVFAKFADRHPKQILFDGVFATKRSNPDEASVFLSQVKQGIPLVTGSFVTPYILPGSDVLPPDVGQTPSIPGSVSFTERYGKLFSGLKAYGPTAELALGLKQVGLLNYRAPGWITPLVFLPNRTLPHLSLFAADHVEFSAGRLVADGHSVSLNDRAETLLNWPDRTELYKRSRSLTDVSNAVHRHQALTDINPGDIVLILPQSYTGNADFKETLVGELPGGYAQAAALNSVLTGRWLSVRAAGLAPILLALAMGCLVALWRRNAGKAAYLLLMNLAALGTVVGLFAWSDVLCNWMLAFGVFNSVGFGLLVVHATAQEFRSLRVDNALRGVVSPSVLERIKADPSAFHIVPREETVTALFLDFVSFSMLAERLSPKEIFEHLKMRMSIVADIIHKHGGIVDRTLGDGMLGFFGFDPLTSESDPHHAANALQCGEEIQLTLARLCLNKSAGGVLPARIGINTGPAYIGDMGDLDRIDLTLVGHPINLAKRFEDAAEPFKILLGEQTMTCLKQDSVCKRALLRLTAIKHHKEYIAAFELNPFDGNERLYNEALQAFREFAGLKREVARQSVEADPAWEVWINGARVGRVVDRSPGGICVDLNRYYANKVPLDFDLKVTRSASSEAPMQPSEIKGLVGIVRWGRKVGSEYRHGVQFTSESARAAAGHNLSHR